MDYNYQVKVINGMSVQPDTDVRIDCPFCSHNKTFTLKNIDGKIMWNCFYALCNAKGMISRDMSPEELKKYLSASDDAVELSPKIECDFKLPHHFTSVHSNARCLEYIKQNNCYTAMKKGLAKIMYDPKQDRAVFVIKEQNKVVGAVGRAILSSTYPKWFVYGKKSNPFICGTHKTAVLVEDCASACAVSSVVTGVALLGTSLSEQYIPHLKKYNEVLVALDRDATAKSFDIASKLCYTIPSKVVMLDDDLKYYNEEKIKEILQ